MTYRLQKTLIKKYLKLVALDTAIENQIEELLNTIEELYANSKLSNKDITAPRHLQSKVNLIL